MKKLSILLIVALMITTQLFAGVVKKTKSEVSFKDFGKFTSEQSEKITAEKKLTNSKNNFKGKGIVGSLSGKFLLKSGEIGEIIDLMSMTVTKMDHKKKEYELFPVEKISSEGIPEENKQSNEMESEEESESKIKIISSEFKVDITGESKKINDFPSEKYVITWVTEWENVETGQKGTDRLITDVWTTPLSGSLQQAREDEVQFTKAYMKSMGLDADSLQQMILGTNWLALLGSMSEEGQQKRHKGPNFSDEMKKIEGYPVIIDGKYFAIREGGEEEEQEEEEASGDVKKMLGGFAKKAIKKGSKDKNEPAFTYYTELKEFSPSTVSDDAFQVPDNYKEKGE
jgi:hypothetical protein